MHVPLSEAKARLTELVRRAEAGNEVVLTRHGRPAVRLTPVAHDVPAEELRRRRLEAIDRAIARAPARQEGECAARSQDWLYGDDGLPA
ncbi:MAG: type II toxin-antitoxin system Phd/YefM family antitoxin [Allosphingosinicella sp.]|uniref:type II toxin-antitoxin system Phd/YefM family antitoxin n=1 Tax=Allosphingosinicella sp. TaxID=2823234 RepID=UPI0039396024